MESSEGTEAAAMEAREAIATAWKHGNCNGSHGSFERHGSRESRRACYKTIIDGSFGASSDLYSSVLIIPLSKDPYFGE